MLRIDYERAPSPRFTARGGDPRGHDAIETIVRRWPGWRRLGLPGKLGDRPVSMFVAPDWPSAVAAVSSTTVRIDWTPAAQARREEILAELSRARQALAMQDAPRLTLARAKRKPMPHQAKAILALRAMRCCALLNDDMGLGKSATALWAMQDAGVKHLTVVCPAAVKWNWFNEFDQTLGCGDFLTEPAEQVGFVIDGTARKRATLLADLHNAVAEGQPTFTVINYDLLPRLTDEQLHTLANATEGVILDESHYIKNRDAERTKLCKAVFGHAERRILMSGTPIMNTIEDLYSQVTFARPGTWPSFNEFAKRHLVIRQVSLGPRRRMRLNVAAKDLPGLSAVMNTLQIRRHKRDVLDLPPKIHTFPELSLCGNTGPVYRAMKDFGLLELEALEDDALIWNPRVRSTAEAVMMRCEQIAQGFCGGIPEPLRERLAKQEINARLIPGRDEIIWPNAPKVLWLLETVRTLLAQGSPPVVFSRFNAPLFWFKHVLSKEGEKVEILHGGLTSKQKAELIEAFQNEELDVLLCQVKCAEGFNLTRSQDVLFYGRDWSPAKNWQAEERCYRIGTTGTVNVQVPIMRKTVEVAVHRRLAAKGANADQALAHMTIAELREAL